MKVSRDTFIVSVKDGGARLDEDDDDDDGGGRARADRWPPSGPSPQV